MTPDDRNELERTAREVVDYMRETHGPACGATIRYGQVEVTCTKPAGHPPTRHETDSLNWSAA